MSSDQAEDYYNQFDHAEVHPKSRREKSVRKVWALQEGEFLRTISDP